MNKTKIEWCDYTINPVKGLYPVDCKDNRGTNTFIFLTKQPQNLPRRFPDNCWVGVSATNEIEWISARFYLKEVQATVKFISFEPLLTSMLITSATLPRIGVSWVIIGQQTPVSAETSPQISWVREIVEAADKAGIPVFLKNNLWNLLHEKAWDDDIFWATGKAKLRQEFPK